MGVWVFDGQTFRHRRSIQGQIGGDEYQRRHPESLPLILYL
jgi:hypothetical protein